MKKKTAIGYDLVFAVAACLVTTTAHAQVATPSTNDSTATQAGAAATGATPSSSTSPTQAVANPEATAPADSTGLKDIVVTAQRRTENLQKAAISVDAASGESLARTGLTSATQLQQVSPSLSVSNVGGANVAFFVRGVGNFSANAYTDPAVAFNFDGVYVGRPASTAGLFYDIERVEVLKGPQGTLYGRNATAGAINVIPVRPKIGEWSGDIIGSYGNYNDVNVQAALNVPIGDRGALRVAGTIADHDGYLSDGTSDERVKAARAQFLAELTNNLTVRVDADYAQVRGMGYGSYYAYSVTGFNPATKSYNFAPTGFNPSVGVLDANSQAYRTSRYAAQDGRNLPPLPSSQYAHDDFWGYLVDFEWKTPIGTVTLLPAYRQADLRDQQSSPGFTPFTQEHFEQTSVEARLGGATGRFDYIAGLYYYNENIRGNYTFAQQVLSSYQDFTTSTESYAAFGRLTYHLTNRFRLNGGLRYTHDTKNINGAADTILQVCVQASCPNAPGIPVTDTPAQLPFAVPARGAPPLPVIVNGVYTGAITIRSPAIVVAETKTDRITYRAAAEYDLAERSLLYASVETGFHSGGFSLAIGRDSFAPEYITAYTIGSKNRFFDNRVQLNLEAFLWKYRNQQVAHFGIDGGGGLAFFTENVGRSTIKGIESDLQVQATPTTLLTSSVQYLDGRYDDFKYNVPASSGNPIVGCPFGTNASNSELITIDCSGKQAFNSPRWTLTFGGQQTIPLGDYSLVLSGDTQYRSSRVVAFEYIAPEVAPPVWVSNASVTLNMPHNLSIAGFIRNIENNRPPVSGTLFGTGNFVTLRTDAPRTYGVRLSAKF